ncbi:putative tyrosinase-like protein tyr-3 [Smittium mucronatum]|uniref:Putative tyrosinase-like protein tyr-3 n=1 Tax=Smittium mucronatum TaxID=133383 RepID=A0A1R0GSL5_9FUNG|nr:putative tyrosinase-like protein tyr-3 [Smittium mucronatum]
MRILAVLAIAVFYNQILMIWAQVAPNPPLETAPCTGYVVRKSISTLTQEEWDGFANACAVAHSRGWLDGLSRIHTEFAMSIHGNGMFLPWHRRFVVHFQKILNLIDPAVVIPYWTYPEAGCITRDYKEGTTTGPFWPMEAIVQLIQNSAPRFANFTTNIENGCHGIVHLGVGGDFLSMNAPNDMRSAGNCYMYDNYAESFFRNGRKSDNDQSSGLVFMDSKVPIPSLSLSTHSAMFKFDPQVVSRMNSFVKDVIGRM